MMSLAVIVHGEAIQARQDCWIPLSCDSRHSWGVRDGGMDPQASEGGSRSSPPTPSLRASHLPSLVSFSLPVSSVRPLPSPDTNALSAGPSCGPWLSLEGKRGAQLCPHEQGLLGIHLYTQQTDLLGVPSSLVSEQKAGWGELGGSGL